MSNWLSPRLLEFIGRWRLLLALPLLLLAATVAWAHGVTGEDQAFLEQSSGRQLIVFMYLGARSQRQASGTFNAPFDGSHGWYWLNRGSEAVTVQVNVTGFQEKLYRPGQQ